MKTTDLILLGTAAYFFLPSLIQKSTSAAASGAVDNLLDSANYWKQYSYNWAYFESNRALNTLLNTGKFGPGF